MKWKAVPLGLTLGIIWGAIVFLATIWIRLTGGGNTLIVLNRFYLGYTVSYFPGSIIGLIWGFINGFIGGILIARLYNFFSKAESSQ
jgi:hypothetical protein